jgi:hypothetical protein
VENWWRLIIWLLIGFVIYFAYGRRHSVMAEYTLEEIAKHGGPGGGDIIDLEK